MANTRQEIVEAAGAEFARHGYEGTSFSRVAAAMDKPKSAIGYHLYPSKQSLALAVVATQEARWQSFDAAIDSPSGAQHWATMLLASAKNARACPVAAGSIRLLHELPLAEVPIDKSFDWREYTRAQIRAEVEAQGRTAGPEVDGLADLLLDASFGVVYTAADSEGADVESRLVALIEPILTATGVTSARELVAAAASHELVAGGSGHDPAPAS